MMEDFTFLAPTRLLLLAVPVILMAVYVVVQARRKRFALRFTSVEMLDKVAPDKPGWRRHLTAVALILAVVAATIGFARPVIAGDVVESSQLVVLAIDTSISMEAEDVSPTRIDSAREAAGSFLASVPEGVAVGVVGFDGVATELISPTTRLDAVERVIDGAITKQALGEGTAIGEAVFVGIGAIESFESADGEGEQSTGAIVLLSDGDTTMGRSNDEAASAARAAGIPVSTIAFGTDSGTIRDPLGMHHPVPVNDVALRDLANDTGGQALTAETADQLSSIYEDLGRSVVVEREQVEIADWFAGLAFAVMVMAAVGSLVWFGRLP